MTAEATAYQLITRLLRESLPDEATQELAREALAPGNPSDTFWWLARLHGVRILVAEKLKGWVGQDGEPLFSIPEAMVDCLDRNRLMALRLEAEATRLLKIAAADGIDLLILKGTRLSRRLYGDPATREAGDIDLLVRRADAARLRDLLLDAGFTPEEGKRCQRGQPLPTSPHAYAFPELYGPNRGVKVELHWGLAPQGFHLGLPIEWLWERANNKKGGKGGDMEADALLMSLILHGVKHRWSRLKWINDVARLLHLIERGEESVDWERLLSEARRFGMLRSVVASCAFAHEELDAPMADEVRVAFERDRANAKILAILRKWAADPSGYCASERAETFKQRLYFQWLLRYRLNDRAGFAAQHTLYRLKAPLLNRLRPEPDY